MERDRGAYDAQVRPFQYCGNLVDDMLVHVVILLVRFGSRCQVESSTRTEIPVLVLSRDITVRLHGSFSVCENAAYPSTPAPRGLVSGKTTAIPCFDASAKKAPFCAPVSSVHVNPAR